MSVLSLQALAKRYGERLVFSGVSPGASLIHDLGLSAPARTCMTALRRSKRRSNICSMSSRRLRQPLRGRCLRCGAQFTGQQNERYCSDNCAKRDHYRRNHAGRPARPPGRTPGTCVECGATFVGQANRRFCSRRCARRNYHRTHLEQRREARRRYVRRNPERVRELPPAPSRAAPRGRAAVEAVESRAPRSCAGREARSRDARFGRSHAGRVAGASCVVRTPVRVLRVDRSPHEGSLRSADPRWHSRHRQHSSGMSALQPAKGEADRRRIPAPAEG